MPNTQSTFVKTQGRCGNGHSGHVTLRDGGANVIAGPITVPAEWKFSQGYGLTVPAGLPAGDNYYVDVDCGDLYGIQAGLIVTNGGVAQLLDYVDGVVNPTPVTVAPTGGSDPVINDSGDVPVDVQNGPTTRVTSGVTRSTRTNGSTAKATTPAVADTPGTTPVTVAPTPTTAAPQELQTQVKKDAPQKIAIKVAHKKSDYPPAVPLGIGGALVLSGGALLVKARRNSGTYLTDSTIS